MNRKKNLEGHRFGRLTVIREVDDKRGTWICTCDCGRPTKAKAYDLVHGRKKSCGCYGKEIHKKDVTGQRFGRLTALHPTEKTKRGSIVWVCQCDCGNMVEECTELLISNKKGSCGCLQLKSAESALELARNTVLVDNTNLGLIRSHYLPSHNTSGVRGVHWDRKQEKWIAQIKFQKNTIRLGAYSSLEEAKVARRRAEQRVFGEYLESKGIEYH